VVRTAYHYGRRNKWTRDEWIIAYEACPKELQSYGPEAPFVREVADLLGRTPAAVSRAFGNLWSAQTGGKRGLKHCSHVAEAVVDEYRSNLHQLHRDAQRLRAPRILSSLTPRLALESPTDDTPLPEEIVHAAAKASGLHSELYFVTTRPGSISVDVGILLDSLLVGTTGWLAITNTAQIIRDYLDRRRPKSVGSTVVATSRTWTDILDGRTRTVEERVVQFYLPGFPLDRLPSESKSRLTGFLAFIKGVRRKPMELRPTVHVGAQTLPVVGRPFTRPTLERVLGIELSGVPEQSIKILSDLVKAARTGGFDLALKSTRRAVRQSRSKNKQ
jgi:hypothetical protein